MKFSISGRHMEVGESLTARAEDACKALANKYDAEFLDASIVMKKENHLFYTDISIKGASGSIYQASDNASDPVDSFQNALQKIESQLRKKKKDYRIFGKTERDMEHIGVELNSYDNSFQESTASDSNPMIIAEILDDLPLMSVSEATKKLSANKRVFIFENIFNNAVNVVYIREDGNFGWIDYKVNR